MLKGLGLGCVVHYVIAEGDLVGDKLIGEHRPATVVNNWSGLNRDDGYANLLVTLDGRNDCDGDSPFLWVASRIYSAGNEPGTWHWPEII